jgi:hypothetical protein
LLPRAVCSIGSLMTTPYWCFTDLCVSYFTSLIKRRLGLQSGERLSSFDSTTEKGRPEGLSRVARGNGQDQNHSLISCRLAAAWELWLLTDQSPKPLSQHPPQLATPCSWPPRLAHRYFLPTYSRPKLFNHFLIKLV